MLLKYILLTHRLIKRYMGKEESMYIVIEMQTNDGITAVVPPVVYSSRNEAEAKFHNILANAAVSSVEIHSCTVLDERGVAILNDVYYHNKENESEG